MGPPPFGFLFNEKEQPSNKHKRQYQTGKPEPEQQRKARPRRQKQASKAKHQHWPTKKRRPPKNSSKATREGDGAPLSVSLQPCISLGGSEVLAVAPALEGLRELQGAPLPQAHAFSARQVGRWQVVAAFARARGLQSLFWWVTSHCPLGF